MSTTSQATTSNSSSSASGSSREGPWQVDWKRPQWQSLSEFGEAAAADASSNSREGLVLPGDNNNNDDDYSRRQWKVVSSTSAQVLREEIPNGLLASTVTPIESNVGSNEQQQSLWVTVTILLSSSTADHSNSNNNRRAPLLELVVVEIFQQPNKNDSNNNDNNNNNSGASSSSSSSKDDSSVPPIRRLYARQLQWPESALLESQEPQRHQQQQREQPQQQEKEKPFNFWMIFTGDAMFRRSPEQQQHRDLQQAASAPSLTAVALCRSPPPPTTATTTTNTKPMGDATFTNSTTIATTDALDALNFLSFGMAPVTTVPAAPTTTTTNPSVLRSTTHGDAANVSAASAAPLASSTSSQALAAWDPLAPEPITTSSQHTDDNKPTDLLLACLTNAGKIHFYSLWKLLTCGNNNANTTASNSKDYDDDDDNDEFGQGWLELMLGATLQKHLQETIRPLSRPLKTVSLSTVPILSQQQQERKKGRQKRRDAKQPEAIQDDAHRRGKADDPKEEEYDQEEKQRHDEEEEEDVMKGDLPSFWDESIWDSSIEPSVAKFRTVDNVPTLCVPAMDYLAIAGKGTRPRTMNKNNQRPPKSTATTPLTSPIPSRSLARRESSDAPEATEPKPTSVEEEEEEEGAQEDTPLVAKKETSSVPSPLLPPVDTTGRRRLSIASGSSQERKQQSRGPLVGGFVTLISLTKYSEIRTFFLPFVPQSLAPVIWGDMTFLLVIPAKDGKYSYPYHPVAIRIDSRTLDGLVSCGEVPFLVSNNKNWMTMSDHAADSPTQQQQQQQQRRTLNEPEQQFCFIPRFKILPVLLPRDELLAALLLVGSSPLTFPPAMAAVQERFGALQQQQQQQQREPLVTLHAWEAIDIIPQQLVDGYLRHRQDSVIPAIVTKHTSSHVARLPLLTSNDNATTKDDGAWCHLGQGWCLVGKQGTVHFVSWEGSTSSYGSFVKHIGNYEKTGWHPPPTYILPSSPLLPSRSPVRSSIDAFDSSSSLPGPPPRSHLTGIPERDEEETLGGDETEEILLEALESISGLTYRESPNSSISSSRRRSSFSHRERSVLLLRHCSSWTQLDDASHNRNHVANQVPVVSLRSGVASTEYFVLSLRRIMVENREAAPFNDVLSWMSQQDDFFTAASVALAILRDAETLRHLWRATEHVEADDEMSKLEGLLDGIVPIDISNIFTAGGKDPTLSQLADMTVGCLVKGGFVMSSTLELFVSHDIHYDPARACLMLVAAAACTVSDDNDTMKSAMGRNYDQQSDQHEDNILWPVRCLLRLGVARGYLAKALILLNATIPDEIRRRKPSGSHATSPSSRLSTALVSLIVGAAPDAADLLLGMVDEQSRSRFWQSLDHETKLALSLVSISEKAPMLRQGEVRAWARVQLNDCIKDEMSASAVNVYEVMPTEWLRQLCIACFRNAGCDLAVLCEPSLALDDPSEDVDDIEHHVQQLRTTRNALVAAKGSGGLDFDLVVPALLLLSRRGSQVQDDFQVSTQAVLEAACYLAGRPAAEESIFGFDGTTVMRLCATSGNVSAGSYLIGGKDGLALKCCDILMQEVSMTMDDAEGFLLNDEVNLDAVDGFIQFKNKAFVLNEGHRQLLRLLDEYVLKVRTYGDFQTESARGKVDPTFAARCCLRTWLCLTTPDTSGGSRWLVSWLRRRLGMGDDVISGRRLACAAILRALVWPAVQKTSTGESGSTQQLLANALDVESKFLVQLAQACCGLVESLPSWVADDVLLAAETASGQTIPSQLTLEV